MAATKTLAATTQAWYDDLRATILTILAAADNTGPEVAEAAAQIMTLELDALTDGLLAAALGHGLITLPRIA